MRALKIAAAGMTAQQMRVEVISNNLANMNTTGYNARRAEFADLHYQQMSRPGTISAGDGTVLPFCGESLTLRWSATGTRKVRREGKLLHTGGPEELLAARVRRWLEAEALALLHGDLADYCARASLPQPDLRLSRAQRRWGSCSSERRQNGACIRINWRLVMAPPYVRRSVVAHEVAHLTHFDHSPAFYAELARLYKGDLAAADAWLKAEGRGLYALFG